MQCASPTNSFSVIASARTPIALILHHDQQSSRSPNESGVEHALRKHLQEIELGNTESQTWQKSDPEARLKELSERNEALTKNSKLLKCAGKLKVVVKPLESLFANLSQSALLHPEIAGLVWGCLKFLIQVLRSPSRYEL